MILQKENCSSSLKTIFRLKKVKIATLEELKNSRFEKWLEVSS
jgi:hypothetical protein